MTLTRDELKRLALPALAALVLVAFGAVLIKLASDSRREAGERLVVARSERNQSVERLARIAEEEREVKAKLDVYQQLKQLRVLGEERRLEWADAIARIRTWRSCTKRTCCASSPTCAPPATPITR
jgi:transposase